MAQYQDDEENVRNLITKEEVEKKEKFKYKSKYADKIKRDYQAVKVIGHPTMGYANPPNQYLKKHTRPMLRAQVGNKSIQSHRASNHGINLFFLYHLLYRSVYFH
uniref:Uncharacterized protein n=1 Tax=Cacopsylla melanoneura TaxID=428564 RepID=A0A8D8ZAJ9_9HEMI